MSKKGGSQTVTQAPDASTAAWIQQVRQAATQAGNAPPVNPGGASGYYGAAMGAGRNGLAALNGDPSALASFMNPYQSNVIDATNQQFGKTLDTTRMSVNDAATKAGAFGGSRYGVALGRALGDATQAHDQQTAGLNYAGFNDAMGRAGTAANLGFGAAGANADLAMQTDPNAYRLRMLMSTAGLPTGMTSTQSGTPGKNPLNGAIGGASIGSSFGPWGAAIGGGLGGLMGLFG